MNIKNISFIPAKKKYIPAKLSPNGGPKKASFVNGNGFRMYDPGTELAVVTNQPLKTQAKNKFYQLQNFVKRHKKVAAAVAFVAAAVAAVKVGKSIADKTADKKVEN